MKEVLIDTDILSYFFKGDLEVTKQVRDYLKEYPKLTISTITQYEVIGGLEYKKATKQLERFDKFLDYCEVINLTDKSVRLSGKIFGDLRRKGITIGSTDILIAGIAMEKGLQLITNNEKHFKGIEGLDVANWKK